MTGQPTVLTVVALVVVAGVGTVAAVDDVSRADADVVYDGPPSDDPTVFQGQVVYRSADIEPNETIEIRHLDDDGDGDLDVDDAGLLESQVTADDDGEVLVDTTDLPVDEYLIENSDNDIIGQFEVVVQRIGTFAFDDGEVTNGGDGAETTLAVASNRAQYRHQISATLDGEELSVADLAVFVTAPVLGTADPDEDGTDEAVVVQGSSNHEIPFDFAGADEGTYRVETRVTDTPATAAATVEVTDLSPRTADADLVDGGSYFRGQLLYRGNVGTRETVEVRRVADDGAPGSLQTRTRTDGEGDLFLQTATFPADEYVLLDGEGGEVARFAVAVQRFDTFAFADATVDPATPTTALDVASNRARYRHQLTGARDGEALSIVDLRTVVEAPVLGVADPDGDGTNEAIVLRGAGNQSIPFDFTDRTAGSYRFTSRVADSTANATATVVVENESLFPEPLPRIGADAPPADPDGDGVYEDVDGDGEVTFQDGVDLAIGVSLGHFDGLTGRQRAAIDYNGGGLSFQDGVDLAIAASLGEEPGA
jgi:hypothetical protein